MNVRLRTKWFWVRVQLQSRKLQISRLLRARSPWHSGNYRVGIHSESVRDMTRRYSHLMVMFTFSDLVWKYPFWASLVQKIKIDCLRWIQWCWSNFLGGSFGPKSPNCLFKMKLGHQNNSKMLNSIAMFVSLVLDRKYIFWSNLVQNIKIIFFLQLCVTSAKWNRCKKVELKLWRLKKIQIFLFYIIIIRDI